MGSVRVFSVVAAISLSAAACGGDDDDAAPAATEAPATSGTGAPASNGTDAPASSGTEAPASSGDDSSMPTEIAIDTWEGHDKTSPKSESTYTFSDPATQPWNICVSIPHLKDAYWVGANYGLVEQAKALGVNMTLVEAGGYENLPTQIQQIENCMQNGDALIASAIAFDGLDSTIEALAAEGKPTIDLINGIGTDEVVARSAASFYDSAQKAAEWIVEDSGGESVNVGWFPGPPGAGFSEDANDGFAAAVEGTSITLLDTAFGEPGKEQQARLVENFLEANADVDYIAGTAVTTEAAETILRERGLTDEIKLVAYYFSPGASASLQNGTLAATVSDSQVDQARIAIDLAVRELEGRDHPLHVTPSLIVVDGASIDSFPIRTSLAPDGWSPVFNVEAGG